MNPDQRFAIAIIAVVLTVGFGLAWMFTFAPTMAQP